MSSARRIETERLILRRMAPGDAEFILLNNPAFMRHIGDSGVWAADRACEFIRRGQMARTIAL